MWYAVSMKLIHCAIRYFCNCRLVILNLMPREGYYFVNASSAQKVVLTTVYSLTTPMLFLRWKALSVYGALNFYAVTKYSLRPAVVAVQLCRSQSLYSCVKLWNIFHKKDLVMARLNTARFMDKQFSVDSLSHSWCLKGESYIVFQGIVYW